MVINMLENHAVIKTVWLPRDQPDAYIHTEDQPVCVFVALKKK